MNDPILIQIDDQVREATPEEAEAILEAQANRTKLEAPDAIPNLDT